MYESMYVYVSMNCVHSREEKTFHNEGGETAEQITQSSAISILGSIQNLTMTPEKLRSFDSAFIRSLDQVTARIPFQIKSRQLGVHANH